MENGISSGPTIEPWGTSQGLVPRFVGTKTSCFSLTEMPEWPLSVWLTGYLSVLMNCQWQSLLCQVEAGFLNMFGEEELEKETKRERSPQYTVQLRGCEVRDGPDTDHSFRITLSMLGDQVAVLEVSWWGSKQMSLIQSWVLMRPSVFQVSSSEEKERWLKLLQDGAASQGQHDNTQENTSKALRYERHPHPQSANNILNIQTIKKYVSRFTGVWIFK